MWITPEDLFFRQRFERPHGRLRNGEMTDQLSFGIRRCANRDGRIALSLNCRTYPTRPRYEESSIAARKSAGLHTCWACSISSGLAIRSESQPGQAYIWSPTFRVTRV